jgi:AcrR family transcriptional regulator
MSIRSTRGPARARQQKVRAHAQREILLAAAGVFARKGYRAATLAELAQAAGYAPPSLYRYFEGKEQIFSSLLQLFEGELMSTFDAPVDRTRPLSDRLGELLRTQTELARDRHDIFDVLMQERPPMEGGPGPVAGFRAGLQRYQARMASWLRRNASRRELACSVEDAAVALAGITHAFHTAGLARPESAPTPEAMSRRVVDLALHGLLARPAAPTAP